MKRCLVTSMSVLHLLFRTIMFFTFPSIICKIVGNTVKLNDKINNLHNHSNSPSAQGLTPQYDISLSQMIGQVTLVSLWTCVTSFILLPAQVFLLAQHESAVGYLFSNMCDIDQSATRTLCCCFYHVWTLIARYFDKVGTSQSSATGTLRRRQVAALCLVLLVIN